VFRLRPGERAAMRRRLPRGDHLPHPRIDVTSARTVVVEAARTLRLEIDGRPAGRRRRLDVEVLPAHYRLRL
jgi:diacylglycerol kinase family enzyme